MSVASDAREKRYDMNKGSSSQGGSRWNRTPGVVDGPPAGVEIVAAPAPEYEEDGRTFVYLGFLDTDSARVRSLYPHLIDRYYDEMTRGANDEMDPLKREDLIKANALKFPPLKVVFDTETGLRYLPDGNHTAAAARRAGLDYFHAEVTRGTLRDALLIAFSANNAHGVTNSDEVRKANALKMLADAEWSQWSDREIARRCGVSPTSVSSWRKELAAQREQPQQLPPAVRRIERNGVVTWMKTDGINANRPGVNARVAPIVEAAAAAPKDSSGEPIALGAWVRTRGGREGKVVGVAGRDVTIQSPNIAGTVCHHAEKLTLIPAPTPAVSARLSEQTDKTDRPDTMIKHVESIIRDRNGAPIKADARVTTRSGRGAKVVGVSGRKITLLEDDKIGTATHYAETLEVVAAAVAEAEPAPTFEVGDIVRQNSNGAVATLTTLKDGVFTVQFENYNHRLTAEQVAMYYTKVELVEAAPVDETPSAAPEPLRARLNNVSFTFSPHGHQPGLRMSLTAEDDDETLEQLVAAYKRGAKFTLTIEEEAR